MTVIKVTDQNAPAVMLLEAMARESKREDLLEKFGIPKIPLNYSSVEAKLTINGVEVDFVKTAQEMWDRLRAHHEEHVLKEAKELVSKSRLRRLTEILDEAEDAVAQEIESLFKEQK